MNANLEQTLIRELRPVAAPRALWDRVELGQAAKRDRSGIYLSWALVGLAAALMVATVLNFRGQPLISAKTYSPQFRSSDAVEIRGWVRANTGLDVPLHQGAVQLIGASVKGESAEVVCKVGDRPVRLVIAKAQTAPFDGSRHHVLRSNWFRGGRVLSWIMSGQFYTLACLTPGDLRAACTLCHGG